MTWSWFVGSWPPTEEFMTAFDILLVTFILVIAGITLIVKWFSRRNHRRLLGALQSSRSGTEWLVEETELEGAAIRLQGQIDSGAEWEMVLGGRDRQGKHQSYWQCNEARLDQGGVIIGYVPPGSEVLDIDEELTPDEMREEFLWRRTELRFGDEAPEGVESCNVGGHDFQRLFVVLATEQSQATNLLDSSIETALLGWTDEKKQGGPPLILFSPSGLTLAINQLQQVDEIQDMIRLGTMLAEKVLYR